MCHSTNSNAEFTRRCAVLCCASGGERCVRRMSNVLLSARWRKNYASDRHKVTPQ